MILALSLCGTIVALSVAVLCILRQDRQWVKVVLASRSQQPVSQDSSVLATGGGSSVPAVTVREPSGDELSSFPAAPGQPMGRRFRGQLLWVQRYTGHVLLDLYVAEVEGAEDAGPAVSILGKLPSSPWSSWQIKSLLQHWAKASDLVDVEISTEHDPAKLHLFCDGLEVVLGVDR